MQSIRCERAPMSRALTDEIPLVRCEAEISRILAKLKGSTPAAFVLAGKPAWARRG